MEKIELEQYRDGKIGIDAESMVSIMGLVCGLTHRIVVPEDVDPENNELAKLIKGALEINSLLVLTALFESEKFVELVEERNVADVIVQKGNDIIEKKEVLWS